MFSDATRFPLSKPSPVKVSIRRSYLLPSIPNAQWLMKVATALKEYTQLEVTGRGHYETAEGIEISVRDNLNHFVASLKSDWDNVQSLNCNISNQTLFVTVNCEFQRAETSIWVEANTQEEMLHFLEVLEKELELEQLTDDERVGGQERRYHICKEKKTNWADWIDIAFSTLGAPSKSDYFSGTIVDQAKPEAKGEITHHFRDFDEFSTQTRARLATARRIRYWLSARRSHVSFEIDLLRWQMRLQIEGRTNEVQTVFRKAEEALSLKQQVEQPYRYRKFAQTYAIKEWRSNKAVADALQRIVNRHFVNKFGRYPAVGNVFATTGNEIEDVHPFYEGNLDEFIRWVGAEHHEINRLELFLEGPLNQAVGIYINRDVEELRVASSLGIAPSSDSERSFDLTEFQDVVDTLRNAIVTPNKPKKSQEDNTENGSKRDRFWIEKALLPATGAVGAALLLLVGSVPMIKEVLLPLLGYKYELEWVNKERYSDPIAGNTQSINWVLKQPGLIDHRSAPNQAARVQITEVNGDLVYQSGVSEPENREPRIKFKELSPELPPVKLNLPAGKYSVLIETVKPVRDKELEFELLGDEPAEESDRAENESEEVETSDTL